MPSEIVTIATNDLFVPDWNPRKLIKEAPLLDLMGYLKAGKIVPKLWVWKGNGQAPFAVISGQRRLLAYRRLGYTELEVEVFDIRLEEAKDLAISSNQDDEMHWWERCKSIAEREKAYSGSQRSLAPSLGVDPATVNRSVRIWGALTPGAVAIFDAQCITEGSTYDPSLRVALALTSLKNPELVEKALKVAVEHKMAEGQAKSLVKWIQAGNPPETFGSAPKTPKQPKPKPDPGIPTDEVLAKVADLAKQVGFAEGRGEDPKPAQDLLTAYLSELKSTPPPVSTSDNQTFKITSPKGFALLRQKVGDMAKEVFKPDTPTDTSISPPNPIAPQRGVDDHDTKLDKTETMMVKNSLKLTEKITHWFVKYFWHKFLKYEHRFCKEIAKLAVPEHYTHSGHKGHSRGKGLTTLALTLLHWAVYGVCQFVFWWVAAMWLISRLAPSLRPWVEWPFRFAARQVLVDFPAWAWDWGSGHLFPAIAIVIILLVLISKAGQVEPMRMWILGIGLAAGLYYGHRWGDQPSPWTQTTEAVSTPVPQTTPLAPQTFISKGLGQPKRAPQPVASVQVYQPSVSFQTAASPSDLSPTGGSTSPINNGDKSATTLYDPKLLAQEIAALPKNCIVKSFPVLTDEGMPGDLAVSRMQGVTDPDKYTMIINGDKKIIVNIATTTTNLIINCKSTDPLNFNGSGPFNVFWEDVLYIHTDEIDISGENPSQHFHCTLIGSGAKNALTFQCNRADDLKHLVSALEYFIRNSRLGHDTTLAGMPYPSQGLVLNNDCVVDKLWANSPMDKAAVSLGDHFWSIGKVAFQKQNRSDLEAGLSTLPVTFFYATASEWDRALLARNPSMANSFRPRLKKVVLSL